MFLDLNIIWDEGEFDEEEPPPPPVTIIGDETVLFILPGGNSWLLDEVDAGGAGAGGAAEDDKTGSEWLVSLVFAVKSLPPYKHQLSDISWMQ